MIKYPFVIECDISRSFSSIDHYQILIRLFISFIYVGNEILTFIDMHYNFLRLSLTRWQGVEWTNRKSSDRWRHHSLYNLYGDKEGHSIHVWAHGMSGVWGIPAELSHVSQNHHQEDSHLPINKEAIDLVLHLNQGYLYHWKKRYWITYS